MHYRITNNKFDRFKKDFNNLVEYYRRDYAVESKKDWAQYEKEYAERIKTALRELKPIIHEAYAPLQDTKFIGRPVETQIIDKVVILLLKDIFHISNRKMANFLSVFSPISEISMSYKTVERLYSDPFIALIIHNMFIACIKRKKITHADVTGDGTGYSLTVLKHYSTNARKENGKKKTFAYAFAFMDIKTKMYVWYGAGMRSEKEAFNNAKRMMVAIGIHIDSSILDKYYTYPSITDEFDPDTKIYILPKSNTMINGNSKWHKIWKSLMYDTVKFLRNYYKRENSESGFAADKKSNGWSMWQRRADRIETAVMCKGLWHNLLRIGGRS